MVKWLAGALESKQRRLIFFANLVILFFSLIGELNLFFVMAIYWSETVIIGLFMFAKLATFTYEGARENLWLWLLSKMCILPFFAVILGFASFLYGAFLFIFYAAGKPLQPGTSVDPAINEHLPKLFSDPFFLVCIIGIFAAHAYQFLAEYVGMKRYLTLDPEKTTQGLMMRFLVMHVMIFITAFVYIGLPSMPAAFLVLVKTLLETFINRKPYPGEDSGSYSPKAHEFIGPFSIIATIAMVIISGAIMENRKTWPASTGMYIAFLVICFYFAVAYLAALTEHYKKGNFGAHLMVTIFICIAFGVSAYFFRETNYRRLTTLFPLGAAACVGGFVGTRSAARKQN